MKNKFLPFSLLALTVGFALSLMSFTGPENGDDVKVKFNKQDAVKAASYLANLRNNQVTGELPVNDVLKAREEMGSIFKSGMSDLSWHEMGPDNLGGRTRALLFDNQDANARTLYAGSVVGGIWRTINLGQTWFKVGGPDATMNVSCMKQDASGAIYVGTGEGFTIENFSAFAELGYHGAFVGSGLYKSTDGETFEQLSSTTPTLNQDNVDWAYVNEIAINNTDVYVAMNSGLMFSSDGGQTWITIAEGNATEVEVATDGFVIAVIDNMVYTSSGDYSEVTMISGTEEGMFPSENIGRIELAIAPSNENIIYASVANLGGQVHGVYRSDDKSLSWETILPGGSDINIFMGAGLYSNTLEVHPTDEDFVLAGSVGLYEGKKHVSGAFSWTARALGMSVNIVNGVVTITGVSPNHHIYAFKPGSETDFFVATDNGIFSGEIHVDGYEFKPFLRSYNVGQIYTVGCGSVKKEVIGGSQGNGVVYISGEFNTDQMGVPFGGYIGQSVDISTINSSILIGGYWSGPNVGTQYLRAEDRGFTPSQTTFLDTDISIGTDEVISPAVLWESFDDANSPDEIAFRARRDYTTGESIYLQSNTFNYPVEYTFEQNLNEDDTLFVQDPIQSKYFIGTVDNLWMTRQALDFTVNPTWYRVSSESANGVTGKIQAVAVSTDGNYAWAGTQEGSLYRVSNLATATDYNKADVGSTNCIVATDKVSITVPGGSENTQVITSIYVDPQNNNNVIVTMGNYGNSNYIYYSTNALADYPTFNAIQGNLPLMPVYTALIEMDNSNTAIIGTENGVFVCENINAGSPNWVYNSGEIGNVPVMDLEQQVIAKGKTVIVEDGEEIVYPGVNNYGVIYAATHGRGFFNNSAYQKPVGIENPIDDENTFSSISVYPNPASNTTTIAFEVENNAKVEIRVFDINGQIVRSATAAQYNKGQHEIRINCEDLLNGNYFVQLISGNKISSAKFIVIK